MGGAGAEPGCVVVHRPGGLAPVVHWDVFDVQEHGGDLHLWIEGRPGEGPLETVETVRYAAGEWERVESGGAPG